MNKLKVLDVIDKFNFDLVANEKSLNNEINHIELNRAGFELSGIYLYNPIKSIIYFGTKETKFLDTLSPAVVKERLKELFKLSPPLIILGKNFKYGKVVVEVAQDFPIVPVAKTKFTHNDLAFTLTQYMIHEMIEYKLYHGCSLEVYGVGVLITGDSGIGKTEVMVELIKKGHIFVADDSIDIARVGTSLLARPSTLTKDFVEIRGLGLLNAKKSFGYNKCIDNTTIEVIIELVNDKDGSFERVGDVAYKNIEGVDVHYYKIPVLAGRNIADIIESAIVDYKLKLDGQNSRNELETRINKRKLNG